MSVVRWLAHLPARLRRRTTGGVYQAEIDGLRFFAIAIVVVGHFTERALRFFPRAAELDHPLVWLLGRPGGGVLLFFSVSGFILATQAMKAKDGPLTGKFLRAYFGRRVLRIEPPYLILLVATWALLSATGYVPEGTRQFATEPKSLTLSLLSSVAYLHDLVWGSFPRLFPPGWSLEVEVQFYLMAPLLFFAYFGLRRRLARLTLGAALLLLGTLSALYVPRHIGPVFTNYCILRFFQFFWLGIMLADLRSWIAEKTQRVWPPALGICGWGALLCFLALPAVPAAPATAADLTIALLIDSTALGTVAAMFVCVFAARSPFRSFCANPWTSLIGGACYSLYLTHLQVIQFLTGALAHRAPDSSLAMIGLYACVEIAAVVAVGLIFYALIERTFMIPDWPALARGWIAKGIPRRQQSPADASDRR